MGIAIAIHVAIVLAVGGYVVYEGIVPVPFFENGNIDTSPSELVEEQPTLIEEESLPAMITPEVADVQEVSGSEEAGPDMSDLITISATTMMPSFSMPTTAGNPNLLGGSLLAGTGTGSGEAKGAAGPRGPSLATMFGRTNASDGLIGKIYDLRRDSKGKEIAGNERADFAALIEEIIDTKAEVDQRKLEKYFSPDMQLSASMFLMPGMNATEGPQAFGMDTLEGRQRWIAYYRGMLQPKQPGIYRFIGGGDELLIVRINGKLVLDATWQIKFVNWTHASPTGWKPDRSNPDPQARRIGPGDGTYYGDWFELDGNPFEMEVTIGEGGGNVFGCWLAIQEKGDEKESVFSLFKTEDYKKSMQPLQESALKKMAAGIKLDGPTFQIPGR